MPSVRSTDLAKRDIGAASRIAKRLRAQHYTRYAKISLQAHLSQ